MVKKSDKEHKLLTEVELELMNIIWQIGECTVRDVQKALNPSRELAYTSIATIMKILEQKKVLRSKKQEKAHIFSPALQKSDYERTSLMHVQNQVFEGDPTSMVVKLLDESDISKKELQAIQKIIQERLKS